MTIGNVLPCVPSLLRAGANIDAIGSEGSTALMTAAESLNEHVVSLLMEANADTSIKNASGSTAADLALKNDDRAKPTSLKAKILSMIQPTATAEEMDDLIRAALMSL